MRFAATYDKKAGLRVDTSWVAGLYDIKLASMYTVPIDNILSVKNARAWVSMVSYLKK